MSKRNIYGDAGEADDDEYGLLGSRFIRTVKENPKRPPHKVRRDSPETNARATRPKPRSAKDRTY